MAYATVEQLAEALEIRVTPDNTKRLTDCLATAATEIDGFLVDCVYVTDDPLIMLVNVNRGVEWFKAPATYNGGVGTVETGQLPAPQSGFERHAAVLTPLRVQWGVA